MGPISHNAPQRFAEQLRSYLWAQIEHEADSSGRWLEKKTDGARSREYWRKITSGAQAMTTNDVEVIAVAVFGQSPYDFIRAARAWTSVRRRACSPEADRTNTSPGHRGHRG